MEEAILSCDGNKAPGLDEYNFNFIKGSWETIKEYVCDLFEEFFSNAKLPRGITSYFLALVPKVNNPQRIGHFRPISLLVVCTKPW